MSLDFDPSTAQEFVAVARTHVVGDLAAATQATTDAAAAVPGLGLIGADFRTQLIVAMTDYATHLTRCVNAVENLATHVEVCRTTLTGHDQQLADDLTTTGQA
ncbi:type VII secretion target [Nocardia asteroides]|uniref:type VII secretion target n=1 Tax=Nocardia asteroides TaxID=1824 RepID=UPI0037CBC110